MRHLKTLASALAVVMVVIMATDYIAMAATGKPLILGKVNKSGKTTTIQSSKGAALKLKVDAGKPPLKVNSDTVVKKLNADLLDGRDSASYLNSARDYRFDLVDADAGEVRLDVPGVAAGSYLVTYSLYMPGTNGTVAAPTFGECFLRVITSSGTNAFVTGESRATSVSVSMGFNGSGLVQLTTGQTLQLTCNTSSTDTFSTPTEEPAQITLTKLASVSVRSADARIAGRAGQTR